MKTSVKYEIKEIQWPAKTFIGKRSIESFNNLSSFFNEQYTEIEKEFQKKSIQPAGPPCAIYYTIDEVKNETDLAAVFPVENLKVDLEGFQKTELPASKVLTTTYVGPYEGVSEAYMEMENYLKSKGYERILMMEEYLTDPMIEPDPAKWITNIYFVLK